MAGAYEPLAQRCVRQFFVNLLMCVELGSEARMRKIY